MTSFLARAKASRDDTLIPMPVPELVSGEEDFTIYLRRPAVRDSDYASRAGSSVERTLRLFIRCARDADGKRLVQDEDLRELMRDGGAAAVNAVAHRAVHLVAGLTVEEDVKN